MIARYRELMGQLAAEYGGWDKHGTKQRVAVTLGISPSVLSKLREDPNKSVHSDTITDAIVNLNLDPHWFYERTLSRGPRYQDYQAGAETADPPHWTAFLERYALPRNVDPSELARIRTAAHNASDLLTSYEDVVTLTLASVSREADRASPWNE